METMKESSDNCQQMEDNESKDNQTEEVKEVIPGYSSFGEFMQEAFDAIKHGIKSANNLPIESNFNYYSCFPSFQSVKEENRKLILNVMQNVLEVARVKCNLANLDVDGTFDVLQTANDNLLDEANMLMDEECGIKKNAEIELVVTNARNQLINGSWNKVIPAGPSQSNDHTESIRLLAARNIQRPQVTFKDKIDNSSKPWCPTIKDKPNSLKPLAIYLEEGEEGEVFCHPYEFELEKFKPPDDQLKKSTPVKYKTLDETPLIMIQEPSDVQLLLNDLKKYKEFAVDLEHHAYRSFQGITCLMQISTGDTDYLIDTLSLRSELHQLNEVFTKPTILKVFHGADLDVQWLQRDLSLYVVNMFDTHQAAKQLNLPYLSLAYLLKHYCNIDPNKHFQIADWRIRPLPEPLQKYAREDTHYLLHIKDILKNSLLDVANGQVNILKAVYDRSTEVCKKTYVKPVWTEESYMSMYRKSRKMFNNKQLYALKELHKWRDQTARQEDDSVTYVLPNHMLLNIAESLPREMQGILACCDSIPPLVRQHLLKLHKIILKAREQPLIKPVLEDLRQRLSQRSYIPNSEAWMYSAHDTPGDMEIRDDLPCLLDTLDENVSELAALNIAIEHKVTVFDSPVASEDEDMEKRGESDATKKKFVFVSPFERYKRVIPVVAEKEAQEREKQKKEEEERLNKIMKQEEEERRLSQISRKEDEEETAQSKLRVHEHFKQVVQVSSPVPSKKLSKVSLKQLPGRKRKRDSDIANESATQVMKQDDKEMLTSVPSLDVRIIQGTKTQTDKEGRLKELIREEESFSKTQLSNKEAASDMRSRRKGDKKRALSNLKSKGMLPSKVFDYKSVDFSSFQGGSQSAPNQVTFQQTMKRKQEKTRRKKKPKINI